MRPGRPLAAVLAAVAVAAAAAPSGAAARSQATSGSGFDRTRVDLVVQTCEECVITAYNVHPAGKTDKWVSPPVLNGRTHLVVPTEETRGLFFEVERPGRDDITGGNAVPEIVLGYRGIPVGTNVTHREASRDRSANPCWFGTTESRVTIYVDHRSYPVRPPAPDDHIDDFWASPTQPVEPGNYASTDDGGLAVQDETACISGDGQRLEGLQ
jgi:hypothetical protein